MWPYKAGDRPKQRPKMAAFTVIAGSITPGERAEALCTLVGFIRWKRQQLSGGRVCRRTGQDSCSVGHGETSEVRCAVSGYKAHHSLRYLRKSRISILIKYKIFYLIKYKIFYLKVHSYLAFAIT